MVPLGGWDPVPPLLAVGTWVRCLISLSLAFHTYRSPNNCVWKERRKNQRGKEVSHPSLQIELGQLDGVTFTKTGKVGRGKAL